MFLVKLICALLLVLTSNGATITCNMKAITIDTCAELKLKWMMGKCGEYQPFWVYWLERVGCITPSICSSLNSVECDKAAWLCSWKRLQGCFFFPKNNKTILNTTYIQSKNLLATYAPWKHGRVLTVSRVYKMSYQDYSNLKLTLELSDYVMLHRYGWLFGSLSKARLFQKYGEGATVQIKRLNKSTVELSISNGNRRRLESGVLKKIEVGFGTVLQTVVDALPPWAVDVIAAGGAIIATGVGAESYPFGYVLGIAFGSSPDDSNANLIGDACDIACASMTEECEYGASDYGCNCVGNTGHCVHSPLITPYLFCLDGCNLVGTDPVGIANQLCSYLYQQLSAKYKNTQWYQNVPTKGTGWDEASGPISHCAQDKPNLDYLHQQYCNAFGAGRGHTDMLLMIGHSMGAWSANVLTTDLGGGVDSIYLLDAQQNVPNPPGNTQSFLQKEHYYQSHGWTDDILGGCYNTISEKSIANQLCHAFEIPFCIDSIPNFRNFERNWQGDTNCNLIGCGNPSLHQYAINTHQGIATDPCVSRLILQSITNGLNLKELAYLWNKGIQLSSTGETPGSGTLVDGRIQSYFSADTCPTPSPVFNTPAPTPQPTVATHSPVPGLPFSVEYACNHLHTVNVPCNSAPDPVVQAIIPIGCSDQEIYGYCIPGDLVACNQVNQPGDFDDNDPACEALVFNNPWFATNSGYDVTCYQLPQGKYCAVAIGVCHNCVNPGWHNNDECFLGTYLCPVG